MDQTQEFLPRRQNTREVMGKADFSRRLKVLSAMRHTQKRCLWLGRGREEGEVNGS